MEKVGVISAVLDEPKLISKRFNKIVSDYNDIVRGRMGIPFLDKHISVVSITLCGELDRINDLTGKLGNLEGVTVKVAISKKDV